MKISILYLAFGISLCAVSCNEQKNPSANPNESSISNTSSTSKTGANINASSVDHLIIGKWTNARLKPLNGKMPSAREQRDLAAANAVFSKIILEFYKDKTYEISGGPGNEQIKSLNGRYEFINDGKYIILSPDTSRTPDVTEFDKIFGKMQILVISDSSLQVRIKNENADDGMDVDYSRAKSN